MKVGVTMDWRELSNYDDSIRNGIYYEYYLKAKYAAKKMGLDELIFDKHPGKVVTIDTFKLVLVENVVVIFVDNKRVFYYDPDDMEIESVDGKWLKLVDILYQTVVDVEKEKEDKIKRL